MPYFDFPAWSDLADLSHLSNNTQYLWDAMLMSAERNRRYFDGDVFQERVPAESGNDEEAPLLFPVGLNLVKMMCLAQTDSELGEWDTAPVIWGIRGDQEKNGDDERAIELANNILFASNAATFLWEVNLDRNVFGGAAFKVEWTLDKRAPIRWSRMTRDTFYPVWDPDNPDNLLEVYIVSKMSREQAAAKYRYTNAPNDLVTRIEHWTVDKYESFLDNQPLLEYSGVNPYRIVPFVYIPRFRANDWWGEALTPDIIPAQDDLNMRVADVGDAINYNAHPVRWGLNLPRDFTASNFPLGPNAFWNLGRTIGNSPKPEVGLLEAKAAVAEGVFNYINFVYDWTRTSASAPPIAFGEDNGGGQRSGVTLEIRMWPLIKAVRRSRAYLAQGLSRGLEISARILAQKRLSEVPSRALETIQKGRIVPSFHSIMPRDQQAVVDEVVKLLATKPPSISLETAQSLLGRGPGEVDRIKAMLSDEELWAREDKEALMKQDLAEKQLQFKQEQADKKASLDAEKAKQASRSHGETN